MLGWEIREDKRCPMIYCDICGGLIQDAKDGIVHFDQRRVHVVHKRSTGGLCDPGMGEWQDLGVFLCFLERNLKIDREATLERARLLELF